ncbi:hypothetical protein [Rhizobium sp. L43]|uniref:hypothetical protein n=1 Tax=Rhizobium sp. L43 TaxID=2035452 RepID=UPI000BE82EE1|nr:hypothetical protein [Rhizobium sp. L43]PDS77380.1 hypothetical protein CO667_17125 [Rhizobium sp. L43]
MRPEPLFLERCEQVQVLLESNREIEILDLAARLRQLLLDQHCLAGAANTNKVKLRFEVGHFDGGPDPFEAYVTFRSLEDGVDPQTRARPQEPLRLNLDEFMAHKVMIVSGAAISIKEIIRHVSNVAGGVHYDPNPKQEYKLLQEVGQMFGIGGLPAGVRVLKAMARVALRGLQPLIDDVRKRHPAP